MRPRTRYSRSRPATDRFLTPVAVLLLTTVLLLCGLGRADEPVSRRFHPGWQGCVRANRGTFVRVELGQLPHQVTPVVIDTGVLSFHSYATSLIGSDGRIEVAYRAPPVAAAVTGSIGSGPLAQSAQQLALRWIDPSLTLIAFVDDDSGLAAFIAAALPRRAANVITIDQTPSSLPTHWQAYETIDWLVLTASAARLLSLSQAISLQQWVLAGGQLLILVGADSGSLGQTHLRPCLPGLPAAAPALPARLTFLPRPAARVLVGDGSYAQLLVRDFGDGTVLLAAAAALPGIDETAAQSLVDLLARPAEQPSIRGAQQLLHTALGRVPASDVRWLLRLRIFLLVCFLVFVAAHGACHLLPVRVRRRYLVLPGLSVILAICMAPAARWIREGSVDVRERTVVIADAALPWSLAVTALGIDSKAASTVSAEVTGSSVLPLLEGPRPDAAGQLAVVSGPGTGTRLSLRTMPGSRFTLVLPRVLPSPLLIETANTRADPPAAALYLRQLSATAIEDSFLLLDGKRYVVPQLKPGHWVDLDLRTVSASGPVIAPDGDQLLVESALARHSQARPVLFAWLAPLAAGTWQDAVQHSSSRVLIEYRLPAVDEW